MTRLRIACAVVLTISLGLSVWDLSVPGLLDRTGRLKGPDFLQFYTYGALVDAGEANALYSPEAHAGMARLRVDPAMSLTDFHPNYSPVIAWLMAPLASLPFLEAMAVWTAVSIALYAAAVALLARLTSRLATDSITLALAAAAWPALFVTLRYGQISTLSLLILATAVLLDARRLPFTAGVVLGCLAYKPTLVVIPIAALVLARQWRLLGGVIVGGALETVLGYALAGGPVFSQYVGVLASLAVSPDAVQIYPAESHSIRGFVRLMAPSPPLVAAALITGVAGTVVAAAYVWRREGDVRLRWAALTLATLAGSPHLLTYDLLLLVVPLVLLTDWWIENGPARVLGPWMATLVLLYASAWPGVLLARIYRVQISTIGMVMGLWLLVRHSFRRTDPSDAEGSSSGSGIPRPLDPQPAASHSFAVKERRFDVVEVVGIAIFGILVGLGGALNITRHDVLQGPTVVEESSLSSLQQRFGPGRYSQGPEEWIARDFFDDQRDGVFVDVGASYPFALNNTVTLERKLGWSGVAVDALEELAPEYRQRPRTKFFVAFVGDSNSGTSTIFVDPDFPAVSSSNEAFTARFARKAKPRRVVSRTLDSLLNEAGVTRIDYLSMDIELGEPAALRGFSIARFRPRLACIEVQGQTRQQIIDYFVRNGYTLVGKYLHVDKANLYFKPLV
jgi:FkbM family methyltransferase